MMVLMPLLKMALRALPLVILNGLKVQKAHQRTMTQAEVLIMICLMRMVIVI